jgi:3'-5' exoribonuclease
MATTLLLSDLANGQEGEFFALLAAKEENTTKHGKPFFRVTFRDSKREVSFPIWGDAPLAKPCRDDWTVGAFYKLRAAYRDTEYGPQLDIRRIREVTDDDVADGFDSSMCLPKSRREAQEMFDELRKLVTKNVKDKKVAKLVTSILDDNRDTLLRMPAATHNHHAYAGGFLEHVLSVTHTCLYFAEKYADACPEMNPPLDTDLVIVGGVLHDIGKLRELTLTPAGADYSAEGALIGHMLQGRDILLEAAAKNPIDKEKLLRLEHIIISHQRLPEWGAPKPPMTPEALLVHYADDCDAKLNMMMAAIAGEQKNGPLTSSRNPLKLRLYRGALNADATKNGDASKRAGASPPPANSQASPTEEAPLFGD